MIDDEDAKKIADAVFDKFSMFFAVIVPGGLVIEKVNALLEPPLTYLVDFGAFGIAGWLYWRHLGKRFKDNSKATLNRSPLPPIASQRGSAYSRATGRYEEI